MSKNNIGLYSRKQGKYLPFDGDRLAKPTPYNTDGNPEAFNQFLQQSSKDPSVVLCRIPSNEIARLKAEHGS